MNILVNASNLSVGGGLQVADSICRELYKYPQHNFTVVLPSQLIKCFDSLKKHTNITPHFYNLPSSIKLYLTGRDEFLDSLILENKIEGVLTVFGPSKWNPKCFHLCGFARSQIVLPDSPFWKKLKFGKRLSTKLKAKLNLYLFEQSTNNFFTENPFISLRLKKFLPKAKIHTVTNNYNQIFDFSSKWDKSINLPPLKGLTLLTISANYPHKNLDIIGPTIEYILSKYPLLKFRFVLSLKEEDLPNFSPEVKKHIIFLGPVDISQCPWLYSQSDVMFLPTLLECFSASYAEAMKMEKPILTSDLGFAHSICEDAALYFNPLDPKAIGEAIYKIYNDNNLKESLKSNANLQLQKLDTYEDRCKKLISIMEDSLPR